MYHYKIYHVSTNANNAKVKNNRSSGKSHQYMPKGNSPVSQSAPESIKPRRNSSNGVQHDSEGNKRLCLRPPATYATKVRRITRVCSATIRTVPCTRRGRASTAVRSVAESIRERCFRSSCFGSLSVDRADIVPVRIQSSTIAAVPSIGRLSVGSDVCS